MNYTISKLTYSIYENVIGMICQKLLLRLMFGLGWYSEAVDFCMKVRENNGI